MKLFNIEEKDFFKKRYLSKYNLLCKETSSILNSKQCSIGLFAIPWLHIIRDHPIYNKNYNDYYLDQNVLIVILSSVKNFLKNFSVTLFCFLRQMFSIFGTKSKDSESKVDTIFLSHLVNSKHLSNHNDFYFGEVPMELSKHKTVEILYFNWTNKTKFPSHDDQIKRTILNKNISFFQEIKIFGIASIGLVSLIILLITKKLRFKFFFYVLPHLFSMQTHDNIRRYFQFLNYFKNKQPSKVICTFEGHAHEKLFFLAAKKIDRNIKTYAYQHSALFKNQYSVLQYYRPECKPDHILTSGSLPAHRLKDAYPESKLKVVGSHKSEMNQVISQQAKKINFLFVPEGFESESLKMLFFAQKCADLFPGSDFIFRLHPLVADSSVINNELKSNELPNLIFSDNPINVDIELCHFVIYRGSTAVLDAAINKLIPIFFDDPEDHSELDVLYMIEKKTVIIPSDLRDLIDINIEDLRLLQNKNIDLFNLIKSLRDKTQVKDFGLKNV